MQRKKGLLPALLFVATTSTVTAAEETGVGAQIAPQRQSILFATPLLSESEQADYRARIRAATDAAEKERIRAAHYELMKVRARERGYALPDSRPAVVGEAGTAFGPELTTEEERAAQRARLRGAGKQGVGEALRPARGEPPVETPLTGLREQVIHNSMRAGEIKLDDGARVMMPASPSSKPAESVLGGIVLPGIDAIFGPQLMSEEEKAAFRARLRSAKSDGERQG